MRPRMNVYLTTAKKVLMYAYPTILSLFENNQNAEIFLYLVSENIEDADIVEEKKLANQYKNHIEIIRFDESRAEGKITCGDMKHWPLATLGCYWLFHELLPKEVDRIIALEADTVVTGSLIEFYQAELSDCYVVCPDPEHKPLRHQEIMKRLGGDVLTFVVSVYDVNAIRRDFSLEDILLMDKYVVEKYGYSQQELTFGMLFKDKIKYWPANTLCIEENRQSMETLGYDYLVNCENECKVLHFSSCADKGKPWNPVCMMPGYVKWWDYAKKSPYYKKYFLEQWKMYDYMEANNMELSRGITHKNILLSVIALFVILLILGGVFTKQSFDWYMFIGSALLLSFLTTIMLRKVLVWWNKRK